MKIICIGRNYVEHIEELKNSIPEKPIFFLKPETALIPKNLPFFIPDFSNEIHYETEIVLRINKVGKHIQKEFAHTYFDKIAIGIDFTARDIQENCKKNGHPWEIAKAFDFSAPVSNFIDKNNFESIDNINFRLELNNVIVQSSNTKNMIFKVDEIISYVSQFITLKIGDLIFTGTPAGVGKVKINDKLIAYIENQKMLELKIK